MAIPSAEYFKRLLSAVEDIEREAQTKRNAIEAIFAKEPAKNATPRSREGCQGQGFG